MSTETTLYRFKANLKELILLNTKLKEATAQLKLLKTGTAQYAATSKQMATMTAQMGRTSGAIKKTNASTKRLNASGIRMVSIFKSASIAIMAAFAFRAIISGIKGVITVFAKFEAQMAAVRAISGATDEQFKLLESSAKELGRTTVFTAIQVAQLQEEFARLGFTTPQILAAQDATLDLAAATGESLSSAAAIAGSSLKAYGLEAAQVVRVTNVMGASFTGSALNLERFTQSMKFAAPVAKTAGFTIEETSAMLMTLADAGIHGSIAGNALKNVFIRLGDANSSLNKSIGHTVQGLPQLIVELERMKEETFNLTDATTLLDKRSAPAFLILIDNIEKLKLSSDLLNQAEGDINRMAAIRLDTLTGDFTLLKSATEGLGIAIGETFNLSLRQSTTSLTKWVQSLSESDKFLNGVNGTFKLVSFVIKGFIARMALLRITTITTGASMMSFTKFLQIFRLHMQYGMTATYLKITALKALKVALASTGIGLLIIGLGEFVSWLGKTDESLGEAEFAVSRLNESFNEEMKIVKELGTFTEERHDALREMTATYGDLVGMIDLEILSLQELKTVRDIVNAGSGEQVLITAAEKRIELLEKERNIKDAAFLEEIDRLEQTGEGGKKMVENPSFNQFSDKGGNNQPFIAVKLSNDEAIAEQERRREGMLESKNQEIEDEQNYVIEKQKSLEEDITNQAEANGIQLKGQESYRQKERMINLSALEDFRASTFKEQVVIEEKAETRLADLQRARDLMNASQELDKIKAKGDKATTDKYQELYDKMWKNTSANGQAFYDKFVTQQGTINVKISEFRKYVTNLSKSLTKNGDAFDKSGLSGFKLNKTKDRLKELMDVQIKTINDTLVRQAEGADQGYLLKMQQYNDEEELIRTNQESIGIIMGKSNVAQIQADIKANRNKFATLKNMNEDEWNDLMAKTGVKKEELTAVLVQLQAEEDAKLETSLELQSSTFDYWENEKLKIAYKTNKRDIDAIRDKNKTELAMMDTSLVNIGKVWKKRASLATQTNTEELADIEAREKLGLITELEANAERLAAAKTLSDEMNAIEDARIGKMKEVYSQISGMILSVFNNIAEARIADLETDFTTTSENEQTKFDRKLEIAQNAGQDTQGMEEEHAMKMRALEEQKNIDITKIKKKQFMVEKANNIIMAIINGAQAITKVTAQTGIGAIVAAPLTSALVAAQIGSIMAQKFVGAKGGLTPSLTSDGTLEKFASGGMVHGKSHAQGGEKFRAGGRVVELEGGEAVINKKSTAMFKTQLSSMNVAGGGKKFALGGISPGTKTQMDSATDGWKAKDVANLISGAINSQQVFVSESEITTSQSVVEISEGRASLFS